MKTYSSGKQRWGGGGVGGYSGEEAHRKQTRHVFYPSSANRAALLPHSDPSGGGVTSCFQSGLHPSPPPPPTLTHFSTTPDFTAG